MNKNQVSCRKLTARRGQLLIIEKCGHVPQLEKAAEFNAGLMKFLGGTQGASR